jgi:hypothetical protein
MVVSDMTAGRMSRPIHAGEKPKMRRAADCFGDYNVAV